MSSIPSWGSAAAWPASSCSRVRVDTRGVRSRPVASLWTQALCVCSASSLDPVPPWSGECAATDSHTSPIVRNTSQRCLPSGSQSVDDRSRSASSSGCLSERLCRAPTEPPEGSQHCSSCFSSLVAPVVAMQAGCPLIVPWGSTSEIPETGCRRMPRVARTTCCVQGVSTVWSSTVFHATESPRDWSPRELVHFSRSWFWLARAFVYHSRTEVMTWEDLSDEISQVRCRSMLSSAVVCNCVWMLGHGLLLVHHRPCLCVSGTRERWLTCTLLRILHRCSDTVP